jgi:hypothetical protein
MARAGALSRFPRPPVTHIRSSWASQVPYLHLASRHGWIRAHSGANSIWRSVSGSTARPLGALEPAGHLWCYYRLLITCHRPTTSDYRAHHFTSDAHIG